MTDGFDGERTVSMRAITDEKLTRTKLGDYRLEQFIEQTIWGSVFLAHTEDATQTYLLCILSKPSTLTVKDREAYIEHFQYQASQNSIHLWWLSHHKQKYHPLHGREVAMGIYTN